MRLAVTFLSFAAAATEWYFERRRFNLNSFPVVVKT